MPIFWQSPESYRFQPSSGYLNIGDEKHTEGVFKTSDMVLVFLPHKYYTSARMNYMCEILHQVLDKTSYCVGKNFVL